MSNNLKSKTNFIQMKAVLICSIMIITTFSAISADDGNNNSHLYIDCSFSQPTMNTVELYETSYTSLSMPGTISTAFKPGAPSLLIRPLQIMIPEGKQVSNIRIITKDLTEFNIDGDFNLQDQPIEPYQPSVPIGHSQPRDISVDEAIYQEDMMHPGNIYSSRDVSSCRGYQILTVELYPIKYNPVQGKLWFFEELTIDIELEDIESFKPSIRDNDMDRQWVKNIVVNPEMTDTYTIPSRGSREYPGGLCSPSQSYDYVIITREILTDYSGTYTWDDFIARKASQGIVTTIVSVEDIEACSDYYDSNSLFNDTPALIREFLRDAYEDWGLEYVLIAGDVTGPGAIERRLMSSSAESNIEAEIYWSNLDNSFNGDEDSSWGEEGDDASFDFYSELFIGSIPCDEGIDISNWMTKCFYYEDSVEKDYLDNAAFYGGNTGWSCQGDDFIDFTIYGTNNYMGPDPNHDGPWPSFLGFLQGFDTWNSSNPGFEYNTSVMWTAEPPNPGGWQGGSESAAIEGLKNDISNDKVTLLNGIAHANSDMSLDVGASSWEADYHNTKPFFIHDYGCHCGEMSGSDDGVLHSMLFHSDTELAFAAIYNTGYGWGNLDCTNSSSALQQKLFWEYCFNLSVSGGSNNWQLAKAQQYAKDTLAPSINWEGSWRENIQCSTLFGDPAQLLKIPFVPEHDIQVSNLNIAEYVAHGETQTVSALVRNVGNNTETDILVNFTINGTVVDDTIISSLTSMQSEVVEFTWNPAIGMYLVGIDAAFIDDEYNYENNAVNSTVHVIAAPAINVSPSSFSFMVPTDATDDDTLTIFNLDTAEASLNYNITFSGDLGGSWLSAAPDTGTIAIDDFDDVLITVNTTGLDEGDYVGFIHVESNDLDDPDVVVTVYLTVVYGDDMAAISVNSPIGNVMYGNYIINATVQNKGFYPQNNVIVNCSIFEGFLDYEEDFEADNGEYIVSGGLWEYGTPTNGPSAAHSGSFCWGTDLDSNYPDDADARLESTGINIPNGVTATFSFWQWYDTENYYDGGNVKISIDGGSNWEILGEYLDPYPEDAASSGNEGIPGEPCFSSSSSGWQQVSFDVSAYAGETVMFRWHFGSDGSVLDFGWYIDDVSLVGDYGKADNILVYYNTQEISLDEYESSFIEFTPSWNALMGNYTIQVTTLLAGDEDISNDAIADVVFVEGPELSFNPMSNNFGVIVQGGTDSTSFEIWNSGVGTLNYVLSESCGWVDVLPISGDSTGEHDLITVDIDTTGLPAGSYHCDISISSDGGNDVFGVDVIVVLSGTEIEDVNQSVFDRGFPIRHADDGDWAGAQSFTPTLSTITGVDVYLRKFGTPEFDLTVELRADDPQGTLLDTIVFTPGEIGTSFTWLHIDFIDTVVVPGTDYFIVCPPAPSGVTTSFGYELGYAFGNQYNDGAFWFTRDGGVLWRDLPTMYEFVFKTYGLS